MSEQSKASFDRMNARGAKSANVTTATRNKAIGDMMGKTNAIIARRARPTAGEGALRRLKNKSRRAIAKAGE